MSLEKELTGLKQELAEHRQEMRGFMKDQTEIMKKSVELATAQAHQGSLVSKLFNMQETLSERVRELEMQSGTHSTKTQYNRDLIRIILTTLVGIGVYFIRIS